jgi:hypothetical protein
MTLDIQELVQWGLGLVLAGLCFFAKEIWSLYKKLQEVVFAMKEELPNRYVQKDDFKTMRTEVLEAIGKLDNLVREVLTAQPKK